MTREKASHRQRVAVALLQRERKVGIVQGGQLSKLSQGAIHPSSKSGQLDGHVAMDEDEDKDKKPFVHRRKVDTLTPCRKTVAIGKMSKSAATRDRNVRRTVGDTAALQQQSWFLKLCTFAQLCKIIFISTIV